MPTSLLAAVIGIVLGVGAALIWRTVSYRVRRVDFWPAVAGLASALTGGDEREFFRQYGRVLGLLARYLGRQALILGLSFLPVTLFVMVVAPRLMEGHSPGARDLAVSPPEPVAAEIRGRAKLGDDRRVTRVPSATIAGTLAAAGGQFAIGSGLRNIAAGGSPRQIAAEVSPGFDMESAADAVSLLIFRPSGGDEKLFWPGLGGPEWSFYLALCVASAAGMIFLPRRRT